MSAARKAIGIGGGLRPLRASLFSAIRLLLTAGSAIGGSSTQLFGVPLFAVHQPSTPMPTKPLSSTVFFAITWSETPESRMPMPGGRKLWKLPSGALFGRLLSRTSLCSITQFFITGSGGLPAPFGWNRPMPRVLL